MSINTTTHRVKTEAIHKAKRAVNEPVVEALARFGYIARGAIYALIGLLAVGLAFQGRGQVTDQTGAIQMIAAQPSGKILVFALCIGLVGYAIWGVIRAVFDPLGRGSDLKGLVERAGFMLSAVTYALLAYLAFQYATGYGAAKGSSSADMTATLFAQPFGKWLVIIVGLFWLGAGAGQLWVAAKAAFEKDLRPRLPAQEKKWAMALGRIGYAARGVIFIMIGVLTVGAGVGWNPDKSVGFDSALLELAHQPFGEFLLGIVALGLVAFGIFSMLCARWMTLIPDN